jgi:hypothetical protein
MCPSHCALLFLLVQRQTILLVNGEALQLNFASNLSKMCSNNAENVISETQISETQKTLWEG